MLPFLFEELLHLRNDLGRRAIVAKPTEVLLAGGGSREPEQRARFKSCDLEDVRCAISQESLPAIAHPRDRVPQGVWARFHTSAPE